MKLLLIASLLFTVPATQDTFYGMAENPHYIINGTEQGYYIEEDFNIHTGDTVAIVKGEVYIIECNHQGLEKI